VYGQNLGDLARQERARKQTEAPATTHVYTNEDLARPHILLPQDRDRIQATKQNVTPPAAPAPQATTSEAVVNTQPNATANAGANSNASANAISNSSAIVDDKPNPSVNANANPNANADDKTIASANANATARANATAQPNLGATANTDTNARVDPFRDPNVDPNTLPLGDIARHYRALKAARQQQESQSAAARHPLPVAPVLADPVFVQPAPRHDLQPRPAVPLGSIAPPVPMHLGTRELPPAIPFHSARTSTIPQADKLAPPIPTVMQVPAPIRVQTGDTLWTLARKYLGRGTDWALLAARNPQVADPARLRVGSLLNLPETMLAPATVSEGAQHVRVAPGESLWKLSQARFGNGEAWSCIAQANPELKNANLILPGQVLTIPSSCTSAATARVGGAAIAVESSAVSSPQQ
jgi:nucleoid-associated protein YgaU